jgi:restriction system protein
LQRLNGTVQPVHGADVVVLVINGRFTREAIPFGKSQRIHLVDGQVLARWAGGSGPLWDMLQRVPQPRRSTPPGPDTAAVSTTGPHLRAHFALSARSSRSGR